jgi:hypothetical protein
MERFKVDISTQRIKPVLFDQISNPSVLVDTAGEAWEYATKQLGHPLVQVRGVMQVALERELMKQVSEKGPFNVVARIPFNYENEPVAIYYVQAQQENRPSYKFKEGYKNISHEEALRRALEKAARGFDALPDGYSIKRLIPDSDGNKMNAVNDGEFNVGVGELAKILVNTHKACFDYPHDVNQEDVNAVSETLRNNPLVVALDASENVAAVGYIEKDPRFTLDRNITLVEPTYWTVPEHRRGGLSHHLRLEAKRLYDEIGNIISFGESVRPTSFVLILASGYSLSGTSDLSISGNLGNSYTAIGPANPASGYISMGASYYTSSNIRANLDNGYNLDK